MLRSGGKNSIAQAADFLALYLRARPEMAQEIMRLLKERAIPPDLEATIFLALEMAGTPQAHDALISGLGEDHSSNNRSRAAAALPDIPRPEPRTLDALRETARTAVAESPDETRLVRNSATFAIGTLEKRTRVAYPALAKQAVAELRSSLGSAQGDQAQAVALDAIGNSGNPELLTDVKPLLAAPEGLVRAHAVEAMGHMPPEANQDMFGPLIESEQDPRIRGTIAATFADQAKRADQPPPPIVIGSAIQQLGREQDPRVRGLLIDLIGPACAKDPQAMQALSSQFKRESDPMLLKLIGKWVPAGQLGT
jgi:HEAT repeat protein